MCEAFVQKKFATHDWWISTSYTVASGKDEER